MRSTSMRFIVATTLVVAMAGGAAAQAGLPEGPSWGRGAFQPKGKNVLFASGDGCALCHTASSEAVAGKNALGDDVSPHGLWKATMMANAFRDPYWRAQMARETAMRPNDAAAIEALCFKCHAPMVHHTARLSGIATPSFADSKNDPLAEDGVSCTVCHQARPDNFGKPESFGGNLDIRPGREIYGPYEDPVPGPMRMHSAFTPTHGPHVQKSALCGSCHTLVTTAGPGAAPFHEQSPYLEWRNSIFSDETEKTAGSRSCQECHMPDQGSVRLAHNPRGIDFNIEPREHFRAHTFVGGNAYMLDIFKKYREELGVTAPDAALERSAQATRRLLGDHTASVTVLDGERKEGEVSFDVLVANRCGHKFPSGYPSRRAWLQVEVRQGGDVVFNSGAFKDGGRIALLQDELAQPHRDVITKPEEVQIYETVAVDTENKTTTSIVGMAKKLKDNRLLPRGWKANGPDADATKPIGVDGDDDFKDGSDRVTYRVKLATGASGRITIVARLYYQTIPPAWIDGLRDAETPEVKTFLKMADATPPIPEIAAFTIETID